MAGMGVEGSADTEAIIRAVENAGYTASEKGGKKAPVVDEFLKQKPEWGAVRTVVQSNPQGLGEAVSLALPYVNDDEPLLIILGDTLFEADLSYVQGRRS